MFLFTMGTMQYIIIQDDCGFIDERELFYLFPLCLATQLHTYTHTPFSIPAWEFPLGQWLLNCGEAQFCFQFWNLAK